jgi:hypothetical protein
MTDNAHDADKDRRDLHAKVEDWLRTEGYPLEFATASAFRANGFNVLQAEYTRAEPRRPRREVDVVAHMSRRLNEATVRVEFVIECKWSADKPWVLFSGGRGMTTAACAAQTIGSRLGEAVLWKEAGNPILDQIGLFTSDTHTAFGGRQAFSKSADVVFDVLRAVTSNCRALAEEFDRDVDHAILDHRLPEFAVVTLPVVVVEGRLFEASADSRSLQLQEVERTRVHFRGAETARFPIATVDMVTAAALDAFVVERAADTKALLDVMSAALTELRDWSADPDLRELRVVPASRGIRGLPPLLAKLAHTEERKELVANARGKPVGANQRVLLEGLLHAVQVAVANERSLDYGDAPDGAQQNRGAFLAHFSSLAAKIETWQAAIAQLDRRITSLSSWVPETVRRCGFAEPDYFDGAVAQCFTGMTVGRARRHELDAPLEIHLRVVQDVTTEDGRKDWSAYLHSGEREIKVAQLSHEVREFTEDGMKEMNDVIAAMDHDLQACFEAIQQSEAATSVGVAQDALRALRQLLLDELNRLRMAFDPTFSDRCAYCLAELVSDRLP